jgi:GNAT superfamily N-acetyltransferase
MTLRIRPAAPGDEALVLRLVKALADYEKLLHEVVATEADLARELFSDRPGAGCEIAEWDGVPVGIALWFHTFSTFQGRRGLWLEDLFVEPAMRGKGIGKALIRHLARRCVEENLGRFEWWVLDWNAPSIAFYEAQGAVLQDEWTKCRVEGEALRALAGG